MSKVKYIINDNGVSNIDRFLDLFCDYDFLLEDKDNYPDSIFAFKKDKFVWAYHKDFELLDVSAKIWFDLEGEFNLNLDEVRTLMKYVLEMHFNNKNVRPMYRGYSIVTKLEKHFRDRKIIPDMKIY